MTLAEKIRSLMKLRKIQSIYRLHQMLVEKFGKESISRRTLTTIMNQRVVIRTKVIQQLCAIFNI